MPPLFPLRLSDDEELFLIYVLLCFKLDVSSESPPSRLSLDDMEKLQSVDVEKNEKMRLCQQYDLLAKLNSVPIYSCLAPMMSGRALRAVLVDVIWSQTPRYA